MSYTDYRIEVFASAIVLCVPTAIMMSVQYKLNGRVRRSHSDSANRQRKLARLHSIFGSFYLSYSLLNIAIALGVAWALSDAGYAKLYFLPFAFSSTSGILNERDKKSLEAFDILAKVMSSFAEHSRKTGISGVQLTKENVSKNWPPFALFLRSFHLEQRASNPFNIADLGENRHENEFMRLIERDLNLFVLGLGRQEVLQGAARIQLPNDMDWNAAVFCLAAAADVVFIWPGATDGTIWEMDVCLTNFRRKTIFYVPKMDVYLASDGDKKLHAEFSFIADILREAGYETPALFEETIFWIYSDDNSFRAFGSAADSYTYVSQKASDHSAEKS